MCLTKDGNKNKVVMQLQGRNYLHYFSCTWGTLYWLQCIHIETMAINVQIQEWESARVERKYENANVFLAGPMLYHALTPCQYDDKQQSMNGIASKVEGNGTALEDGRQELEIPSCDTGDGVIFCFIYKFRTHFAVVGGEIIRRIARVKCIDEQSKMNEQGRTVMRNVQRMQDFCRAKGMLVTDLSRSSIACGISTHDTPVYNFNSASNDPCCETDANECC